MAQLVKLLLVVMTTWMGTRVQAVDIQGYSDSGACSGAGYTFAGIGQNICTVMNVGSILIRDLSSCQTGRVFRNGGCSSMVGNGNGPTVRCFTGGSFTGADWLNGCVQSTDVSTPCTHRAVPNGVHYTKNLDTGSWVLKTPNAANVLAQLMRVDDAQKVNWLKARGAYYVAGNDNVAIV